MMVILEKKKGSEIVGFHRVKMFERSDAGRVIRLYPLFGVFLL
jgi:hypothetical protein